MEVIREVAFFKDYFDVFFDPLPEKVKHKIDEVLFMFTIIERFLLNFLKVLKVLKDFLKYASNTGAIFTEFFVASTKET